MSSRTTTICLATSLLLLGCSTTSGLPSPCPEWSRAARLQRDQIIQLDRAGRLQLPAISGTNNAGSQFSYPPRTGAPDLVLEMRRAKLYCDSIEAFRE